MIKPDYEIVLKNEGIETKQVGKRLKVLCPLHFEKVSSFMIDIEKQIGHCFGCGFHGDVITFIQKYKCLSFREAVRYLGINGKPYKPNLKEIKKRELLQKFKHWCNDYYSDLCTLYRILQKAKEKVKTIEEVEAIGEFYHQESLWLYQIEVLQGSDDEIKFNLFREVVHGN